MAKSYSNKSRFQSKYTIEPTFVSDHQYLAELICEKIAVREKVKLSYNFWNEKRWKGTFVLQCKNAAELLKEYDVFVIIEALKDIRCKKVYSLGARYVLDKILKELSKKKKLKSTASEEKQVEKRKIEEETIRPIFVRKNPLGEL